VAEIQQANEGGVAFEVEEAGAGCEVPDFDQVVHGAGDASVASVVQDDGVDFLGVALEAVHEVAGGNLPDADGAVV
jgi:hypothetical protein